MKGITTDGAIRASLIIHIESKAFISSDFGFSNNSENNVADTTNDHIAYAPKPCLRRVAIISGHTYIIRGVQFPLHTISNRGSHADSIRMASSKNKNHYVKAAI